MQDKYYWGNKFHWVRFVLLIITNKKFRYHFKDTLLYALRNYEEKRGEGASDVFLFDIHYYDELFTMVDKQ